MTAVVFMCLGPILAGTMSTIDAGNNCTLICSFGIYLDQKCDKK